MNKHAIKEAALTALHASGAFRFRAGMQWRRERLLILCYHSFTLVDEDLWNPSLYFTRDRFAQRLEALKRGGYNVLELGEAFDRMRANSLPPKAVVITVDDGTYDFYKHAYPLLKQYNFPATVYLTTYLSLHQDPVFLPTFGYMLWKSGMPEVDLSRWLGAGAVMPVGDLYQQQAVGRRMMQYVTEHDLSHRAKTDLLAEIAAHLRVDFDQLKAARQFMVMNPEEVREVSRGGIDIQLHTHRHRTPVDHDLFVREIRDNRAIIQDLTGKNPVHFCYPSGNYNPKFLPWLREENVITATTCKIDLADRTHEPLLLPRYVDTMAQTAARFESWCSGAAPLLPRSGSYRYEEVSE